MGIRYITLSLFVLLWATPVDVLATVAIESPARSHRITNEELDYFYISLVNSIRAETNEQIIETREFRKIIDHRDLGIVSGSTIVPLPDNNTLHGLSAKYLLIPDINRINSDYILTARLIDISSGQTVGCAARTTRLTSHFANETTHLVKQLWQICRTVADTTHPPGRSMPPNDDPVHMLLWKECVRMKAQDIFPLFYSRTEEILATAPNTANVIQYIDILFRACVAANDPPEGMLFIPGGKVHISTNGQKRDVWCEPFFIDQYEVAVADYKVFLSEITDANQPDLTSSCRPITFGHSRYEKEELPVTGIPYKAASSYALWRNAELPTLLQWLRAAQRSRKADNDGGDSLPGRYVIPDYSDDRQNTSSQILSVYGLGNDVTIDDVYGLRGNVREWTATWYNTKLYMNNRYIASREPGHGQYKCVAGGSWRTHGWITDRFIIHKIKPKEAYDDIGFRCVVPFTLYPAEVIGEEPQKSSVAYSKKEQE